jgi:hypothetical protein
MTVNTGNDTSPGEQSLERASPLHKCEGQDAAVAGKFSCDKCCKNFSRKSNYLLHERLCCFKSSRRTRSAYRRLTPPPRQVQRKRALQNSASMVSFASNYAGRANNITDDLNDFISCVRTTIANRFHSHGAQRYFIAASVNFKQAIDPLVTTDPNPTFRHELAFPMVTIDELDSGIVQSFVEIERLIDEYERNGSGWVYNGIEKIDLHMATLDPLRASSYVPTPKSLQLKRAVLNIVNQGDNRCFEYSCLAALKLPRSNRERAGIYRNYPPGMLNMDGIGQPMTLSQITEFEHNNSHLSVNVFAYECGKVLPVYISIQPDARATADLLVITDGEKRHYTLITNMSRLLSSQISHHEHKKYFCRRCLNAFGTPELLEQHVTVCARFKLQVRVDFLVTISDIQ